MYKNKISERYIYNKKKSLNILIVDDDSDCSNLFMKILELRGHKVDLINEGIRCVSKCYNTNYDIIFMDYHIEDIDGDQISLIIREDLNNKSNIFAYTGDKSLNAINTFKNSGMDGALYKPIDINLLNDIMNIFEDDQDDLDKESLYRLSKKSKGNIFIF